MSRQGRKLTGLVAVMAISLSAAACTSGVSAPAKNIEKDGTSYELVPTFQLLTKTAADDPRRFEATRLIVEAWQEAGIPVEIRPLADAELTGRTFTSKNFDAYLIEYSGTSSRLDPSDFLGRFTSANAEESGNNVSGYQNLGYDALFQDQFKALSDDDRKELVDAGQQMLYDDQPVSTILHPRAYVPWNSKGWSGAVNAAIGPGWNFWSALRMMPKGSRASLVVGGVTEAKTFNPLTATLLEEQVPLALMYDSLMRLDEAGEPKPWAASDVQFQGNTVVATLRGDMKFHDGKPVTAEDVKYTYELLKAEDAPLYASRLAEIAKVAIDGNQVIFTLEQPSSSFATTTLSEIPILPKHVWSRVDDPVSAANENPVGSGPFEFAGRELGRRIVLEANKAHFQAPKADKLIFALFGSRDAAIQAVGTGEADVLSGPISATQAKQIEGKPSVSVMEADGFGWVGVHYNLRKPPFDNVHLRRALSHLIPTQDIIDIVYDGGAIPASSVIATQLNWHNKKLKPYAYNVDVAVQQLEAGGFVVEDGELYQKK